MSNIDENEVQRLIQGLDWRYSSCINTTSPKSFFLNLFDYGRFISESPILEKIVDLDLKIIQSNDQVLLDDLMDQVTEETDNTFSKLKKFVFDTGIKNAGIQEDIESFNRFKEGKAQSTAGPIEGKIDEVKSILRHLNEILNKGNETEMFLRKFVILNDSGGIFDYTFSPSYFEYIKELERHFRTRESTVWFSWSKINFACRIYFDFEGIRRELENEGKTLSSMGLGQKYEELENIIDYKKVPIYFFDSSKSESVPKPNFFKEEDFRRYLGMLHRFLKEELQRMSPEEKLSIPNVADFKFDGKYWIKGAKPETGKINPTTKDYKFLRAILEKQNRDLGSGLTVEEAWNTVESGNHERNGKKRRRILDGDFSNLKKKTGLAGKKILVSTGGFYRFTT